ncbi:hypothetical protein V8E53_000231 [Lactarius tabidus]
MESDSATSESSPSHPSIEHEYSHPGDIFSLTREDKELLSEYLEEFGEGDVEMRSTIIENSMAELVMLRPAGTPFNKEQASGKVRKWFYNHYDRPERQYVKFIRGWSARNTFYHMCRDEVMTEAEKLSGSPPGSRAFFSSLQNATTKLWKCLPNEEQQVYVRLANKWSGEPPPANIQARMASSVSARIIRDFQSQLFRSCGVRCIVLTAHQQEDNTIVTGMFDTNKEKDAQKQFLSFCPDWKTVILHKEWQTYAKRCYGGDDVPSHPQTVLKNCTKTRSTPIPIPVNRDGCPDVPNITKDKNYKTKTMQAMLREYLTDHIRYVSGNRSTTISWVQVCATPSEWIAPQCTPDGFTWADPSKICIGDIHLLLEHWCERKRQHLPPLIWAKSCPVLKNVSLWSEKRQEYHPDRSPDDSFINDDRSEPRSNTSDPRQNSDFSMSSRSDRRRSNSIGRSDTRTSNNSPPISKMRDNPWTDGIPLSESNADDTWGGFGEDSHMSSLPLHQTYSPHGGLGKGA